MRWLVRVRYEPVLARMTQRFLADYDLEDALVELRRIEQ